MDLNSIKRTILAAVGVLALSSVNAVAQEIRSEISLQGTGFFTKDADGNGIRQHATDTGGFLIGYRYNFNRWLAAEANGYDRNTQIYFGGTGARVESNIHQITGSAVVKLPSFARLQPYALAGRGALVFDPTGNAGGNFAGATIRQAARTVLAPAVFDFTSSLRGGYLSGSTVVYLARLLHLLDVRFSPTADAFN
jgi:hypothetical protein